jgi:hypothetical protein
MYLHCASWHSLATLTEVFSCFFLSCKANARVKPAKARHGLHSSKIFVFFCVFVCKYVLYYCHRVATQLQLTNISYHIKHDILRHLLLSTVKTLVLTYGISAAITWSQLWTQQLIPPTVRKNHLVVLVMLIHAQSNEYITSDYQIKLTECQEHWCSTPAIVVQSQW